MRRGKALFVVTMALMLSLVFAAQAFGLAVQTDEPDALYQARTTKLDISALSDGTAVSSLSDANQTLTFDQDLEKGTPFDLWGDIPYVEDATAPYLFADSQSVTFDLSTPVYEMGFEAAPNSVGAPRTFNATFVISNDGEIVDTISRTITSPPTYNWNAHLLSIASTVPFDRVEVVTNDGLGFGIAQLRYSEADPATVSGTVTDASSGVPIPFATVRVEYGAGVMTEVTADYRGQYSVVLPPATYDFYAWGPGWNQVGREITVDATDLTEDFALTDHYEQAVYRFFNMKGGVHFYTASDAEFINTYANLSSVFHYDGIAYNVGLIDTENQVPLYRFFNRNTGVHFYTASEAEKNNVIATRSNTYTFEGEAYGVRIDGVGTPVYRFYVPLRDAHFFTVDSGEIGRNSSLSNYYHYEGIGYWVGSTPQ